MPRNARLDIPGLLQHVIVRGIEKRDIFLDNEDRGLFLARFSSLLSDTETKCYAWALMSNHAHLLLVPTQISLARFMRRLLTGYAVTFNRKHNRAGHLFQNRYKSIVCEEETYLLELIRYIHLNPLRAGLVQDMKELDGYLWSGHAVLMGKQKMEGQNREEVLRLFGRSFKSGRNRYREFVAEGVAQGKRDDLTGGGMKRSQGSKPENGQGESFDERILGGGSFVDTLLQQDELRSRLVTSLSLSELIDRIAGVLSIPPEEIRRPSKKRNAAEARGIVCYLAVRELNYKGNEIGKELCLSPSGVSIGVRRGEKFFKENQEIKQELFAQLVK